MLSIREIQKKDNQVIKNIIIQVMTEFGATGEGFAIHDDEVNGMFEAYQTHVHHYLVIEDNGVVIGGGGIAPLENEDKTCELRKMYFLPEARGRGLATQMLKTLLQKAKEKGYDYCYLETLTTMKKANELYKKFEFEKINKPKGNTGHFGCNSWYLKKL